MLKAAVEDSFNCISVEGHMSTNDTVLALANGASGASDDDALSAMIAEACVTLARMIPDDGEGATHLITIDVEGAATRDDARAIARAVADSPLVKTAIHGADPNWGRIVSAAGYAGVAFEEADLSLWLNEDSPSTAMAPPCPSTTPPSRPTSGPTARPTSGWSSTTAPPPSGSGPATSPPNTSGSTRITRPDDPAWHPQAPGISHAPTSSGRRPAFGADLDESAEPTNSGRSRSSPRSRTSSR